MRITPYVEIWKSQALTSLWWARINGRGTGLYMMDDFGSLFKVTSNEITGALCTGPNP